MTDRLPANGGPAGVRIVVVDDHEPMLLLIRSVLANKLPEIETLGFRESLPALETMRDGVATVLVTDWQMPGMDGLGLTRHLTEHREKFGPIHIIFLSGTVDPAEIARALDQGANDYVRKPFDTFELIARIRTGIRTLTLETNLRELNRELELLSTTDPLTGAANRRKGMQLLTDELQRTARGIQDLAVMMIDIDHFKRVNDTHGHPAGDLALQTTCNRIRDVAREYNQLVRWGGEEFLLIAPATDADGAVRLAGRLNRVMADEPVRLDDGSSIAVTISIGVAIAPAGWQGAIEALLTDADQALYAAKEGGRNRTVLFG